jgi:hypothetical protein
VSQHILDPSKTPTDSTPTNVALLPRRVRDFGFVPALEKVRPGDLILYGGTGKSGDWIKAAQARAGFSDEDARWTHAAIYLDEGFLVEAVVSGVVQRSIYDDIPTRLMRFRRIDSLTDVERYRIALRALSRLGRSYAIAHIPSLGRRLWQGLWNGNRVPDRKGIVICSQIFHDSAVEITRSRLDQCPVDAEVTPAHLSCSTSLVDVEVGWRRVV